jgi:hypothetical protein
MKTFTYNEITDGEIHELTNFHISTETALKTKNKLLESILSAEKIFNLKSENLMPSELWATARNLSQTYDKLNEVVLARSTWNILGSAKSDEKLNAKTTIKKLLKPYILMETTTYKNNIAILKSKDYALLLHNSNHHFIEPIPETAKGNKLGERKIYFRHEWNETKWRRNIHTTYAKNLGYREEIPEFIIYMDWIYSATNARNIEIKKILPLYRNEKIDLLTNQNIIIFSKNGEVRLKARIS